jgi:hypothetical protein
MSSEARKITAQYLNGLAVAVLATTGGALLAGEATIGAVVLAALASVLVHLCAAGLVRGHKSAPGQSEGCGRPIGHQPGERR